MDIKKLKEWLDITKQCQQDQFWKEIFHPQHESPSPHISRTTNEQQLFPPCDVYILGNQIIIEAEIPGRSSNDFQVNLLPNELLIKGEIQLTHPQGQYLLNERHNKKFEKRIPLPFAIIRNEIRSIFQNGLLQIILPIEVEPAERIDLVIHNDKMQS